MKQHHRKQAQTPTKRGKQIRIMEDGTATIAGINAQEEESPPQAETQAFVIELEENAEMEVAQYIDANEREETPQPPEEVTPKPEVEEDCFVGQLELLWTKEAFPKILVLIKLALQMSMKDRDLQSKRIFYQMLEIWKNLIHYLNHVCKNKDASKKYSWKIIESTLHAAKLYDIMFVETTTQNIENFQRMCRTSVYTGAFFCIAAHNDHFHTIHDCAYTCSTCSTCRCKLPNQIRGGRKLSHKILVEIHHSTIVETVTILSRISGLLQEIHKRLCKDNETTHNSLER